MVAFNPARLTLARQIRGMNKAELEEASGITTRSIFAYESGATEPTRDNIERLARVLDVPVSFFEQARADLPSPDAVSFRSMTSLTAAQRDSSIGAGALAIELTKWLEERFDLPNTAIPDFRELSPEDAAEAVREQWKLGAKPIRNMVHLLEAHGVRVFSLSERGRELDAYSLWHGARPFCFLNTMKSVEHSRFDAAHELGHLVLHKAGSKARADAEQEANRFAAAFLMPSVTVVESVPRGATLEKLIKLKRRWGVSLAALAYRVHRLALVSDWQHRRMQIEITATGYRTAEPEPIAVRETSQVLNKALASLREDGVSKADIARELCIYTRDLDAIIFGLTMTSVDGEGGPGKPPATKLRLVVS